LYDVDGVASNDVWTVGGSGAAHWDGSAWTITPSPNIGAVHSVDAIASNDVWAVGDGGIMHWDGSAWTAVSNPGSGPLYGVSAVSANDVWAAGYYTGGGFAQTLTEHY